MSTWDRKLAFHFYFFKFPSVPAARVGILKCEIPKNRSRFILRRAVQRCRSDPDKHKQIKPVHQTAVSHKWINEISAVTERSDWTDHTGRPSWFCKLKLEPDFSLVRFGHRFSFSAVTGGSGIWIWKPNHDLIMIFVTLCFFGDIVIFWFTDFISWNDWN